LFCFLRIFLWIAGAGAQPPSGENLQCFTVSGKVLFQGSPESIAEAFPESFTTYSLASDRIFRYRVGGPLGSVRDASLTGGGVAETFIHNGADY
jgi:hypothetical protein